MRINILTSLLVATFLVFTTGCVPIPYKAEKKIDDEDIEEISNLRIDQIQDRLGIPNAKYTIGDHTCMIYEYPPGKVDIFYLWHPFTFLALVGTGAVLEVIIGDDQSTAQQVSSENEWTSACMLISINGSNPTKVEIRSYEEERSCDFVFRDKITLIAENEAAKGNDSAALLHAVLTDNTEAMKELSGEDCLVVLGGRVKQCARFDVADVTTNVGIDKSNEELLTLCRDADAGHKIAQFELGRYYWSRDDISDNRSKSYMWYMLAASSNPNTAIYRDIDIQRKAQIEVEYKRDKILTKQQISDAMRLLSTWEAGQCENELVQNYVPE